MVFTHINMPVLHKHCVLTAEHYRDLHAELDQLFVKLFFFDAQVFRSWPDTRSCSENLSLRWTQDNVRPRQCMSQPEPRWDCPMSAGWDLAFSRPVTGDYPTVVTKCCPDRSRMLFYQMNDSDPELCRRLWKCHSENSVNLSLAPTQLVQVRSMRESEHSCPSPNSHSDTHRQACMAPIDRLMVGGGGRRATRHFWKRAKFNTADTLSSPQS